MPTDNKVDSHAPSFHDCVSYPMTADEHIICTPPYCHPAALYVYPPLYLSIPPFTTKSRGFTIYTLTFC